MNKNPNEMTADEMMDFVESNPNATPMERALAQALRQAIDDVYEAWECATHD